VVSFPWDQNLKGTVNSVFFWHVKEELREKNTFKILVPRERHHSIPTWHKQGMHSSRNALKRLGELRKGVDVLRLK